MMPDATIEQRPFSAHGAVLALWRCRDTEVVIEAAAGTGKSRGCLEKLHWCAQKYNGCRILIARKTRESMNESTLVTFEEQVLPADSYLIQGPKRAGRSTYEYANGSVIVVAGLIANGKDQRAKVMSTEYDLIYIPEATELVEEEFEKLVSRLRNGKIPYQQLIADCNPDAPTHWLHLRCDAGRATVFFGRHTDNPRLYDQLTKQWTPYGLAYLKTLDSLTGTQRLRLLEGKRSMATGVIFDTWSSDNISEDADYKAGAGEIYWAVDEGYSGQYDDRTGLYTAMSHPRVFLLVQQRPDGRLCVFYESHAIATQADMHIARVKALPYPPPDWAAVDKSAADLKARLYEHEGIGIWNSPANVDESLTVMHRMISPDINEWRRILVHPRCKLLLSEILLYRRDDHGRIVKAFDHTLDALRYLVWHFRTD